MLLETVLLKTEVTARDYYGSPQTRITCVKRVTPRLIGRLMVVIPIFVGMHWIFYTSRGTDVFEVTGILVLLDGHAEVFQRTDGNMNVIRLVVTGPG